MDDSRWLCCFSFRKKRSEKCYVETMNKINEEPYEYVVEKLGIKKVPVGFFEKVQESINAWDQFPIYPIKSSSNYDNHSEECLATYDLDRGSCKNDFKGKECKLLHENCKTVNKKASTIDLLKKMNPLTIVKSKMKTQKKDENKYEISTCSHSLKENVGENFKNISCKEYMRKLIMETFNSPSFYDIKESNEENDLKTDQFSLNSISFSNTNKNNIGLVEANSLFNKQEPYDLKVTVSTLTDINNLLNTELVANNNNDYLNEQEDDKKVLQLEKGCQTENKPSILKLSDIISKDESEINFKEFSYKNRRNNHLQTQSEATTLKKLLPEKELNNTNQAKFQKSVLPKANFYRNESNITIEQNKTTDPKFVEPIIPSLNFRKENEIGNEMDNNKYFLHSDRKKYIERTKFSLNYDERPSKIDDDLNYYPEKEIEPCYLNKQKIAQPGRTLQTLNFSQTPSQIIMKTLNEIQKMNYNNSLDLEEDSSINGICGDESISYSSSEFPENDSYSTQFTPQNENILEIDYPTLSSPRNVQEVRNLRILSESPFLSVKSNKTRGTFETEDVTSPRLSQIGRVAEIDSSENNPVKWKIIIKQQKIPGNLEK